MKRNLLGICAGLLLLHLTVASAAAPLEITLKAASANPTTPQMGDHMQFVSVIKNNATTAAKGLVAWISLIQVDPGHEQPVDLEDWSAHKAVTQASLEPGKQLAVTWPMRLIQAGDYRVVISGVERRSTHIVTSPFIDFHVQRKPVVESQRILPIALGLPVLLGGMLIWRIRKARHTLM